MMQALGRQYVRYYNHTYQRTGTLWEGRFKSCLVSEEDYLFHLYRYIELNPVRAGMVSDPADYSWSSYQCNGLGKCSELLTGHPLYLHLDENPSVRQAIYRSFFESHVEGKLLEDIRRSTHKGLVLGNDKFVLELEQLAGRQLREGKRGPKRRG